MVAADVWATLVGPVKDSTFGTHTRIDNHVFRLHYRTTSLTLFLLSLIVSSVEHFGTPIDCFENQDSVPSNVLTTYCWVHSTFTIPAAFDKEVGPNGVAHPGVEQYTADQKDQRIYHEYYQWVCLMFIFQALCFYFPRHIWSSYEGGLIKGLCQGLNSKSPSSDLESVRHRCQLLAHYMRMRSGSNRPYFYSYVFCECLNVVNVLGNFYLTDLFLGHTFYRLGIDVLGNFHLRSATSTIKNDPLTRIFPRMAKCTFHMYGPSGDVQKHDALCLLSQNIVNEKIYIFLWFWFIFLTVLSIGSVIYRFATIWSPSFRYYLIKTRTKIADPKYLRLCLSKRCASDWFLLYMLSKNINILHYRNLIRELGREFADECGKRLSGKEDVIYDEY